MPSSGTLCYVVCKAVANAFDKSLGQKVITKAASASEKLVHIYGPIEHCNTIGTYIQ